MEDPTTPSSRDPPTAPSSPVVSSYPGVPFASFERASAHVQGRFHDAYAFAKRFGDRPLHAHTLTGQLPTPARSSEVVSAALKSLGAKTRSVEQDRDAWRAKYEDAQRELREVAAQRDEEAAKRAEEARRHQSRLHSPTPAPASPRTTVRPQDRRIERASNAVDRPDSRERNDGDGSSSNDEPLAVCFENGNAPRDAPIPPYATTATTATATTATAASAARAHSTTNLETDDASPSVRPSSLGLTRADLEAATRRAEIAEAALRAAEAVRASDASRAAEKSAPSEIVALKMRLAAERAEHAARLEELDASWRARLRLAAADAERRGAARGAHAPDSTPRETAPRSARGAPEEARTSRLKARVRELERVVAVLTATMSRAKRRASAESNGSMRRRKPRGPSEGLRRGFEGDRRGDSSDEQASDASVDWDSDAQGSGGSESAPAREETRGRGRESATRRKPWGSGLATADADGALGMSPSSGSRRRLEKARATRASVREEKSARANRARERRVSGEIAGSTRGARPPPRPPCRGGAKRTTKAASAMAVARAAGGFAYPEEETFRAGHSETAERRRRAREARRAAPQSNASAKSGVSGVSGVSRARSMDALKRARAAAKRRSATVAAAMSGEFSSPAASLAPSPAASPARPSRRGPPAAADASLAALRAAFEATREEYSRLTLGDIGGDAGAALDDVMEGLRDVSTAIARRATVEPA